VRECVYVCVCVRRANARLCGELRVCVQKGTGGEAKSFTDARNLEPEVELVLLPSPSAGRLVLVGWVLLCVRDSVGSLTLSTRLTQRREGSFPNHHKHEGMCVCHTIAWLSGVVCRYPQPQHHRPMTQLTLLTPPAGTRRIPAL